MPTKMLARPATAGSVSTTSTRRRVIALAVVVALCAAGAVAFAIHAASGRAGGSGAAPTAATLPSGQLQALEARPFLLFRSTALDRDFGRVGLVPAARPASARLLTGLRCDRVDYAAGHGICLTRGLSGILTTTRAVMFGASMRPTASATLAGYPSRARVSPDGSLGATTTFVAGDSYSTMGQFSTRTAILDTTTGKVLLRLENLRVTRDGQPFRRT